jgi:hypothetical protein
MRSWDEGLMERAAGQIEDLRRIAREEGMPGKIEEVWRIGPTVFAPTW